MTPLYSLKQSSAMDHALIEKFSLSEDKLIESAAKGAFEISMPQIKDKDVLFLVGKGNNGSDALSMARLSLGVAKNVYVLLLFDGGNQENMRRRELLPPSVFVSDFRSADTIVDGVFGFSFHGEIKGRIREIFDEVERSDSYKIALDVPSGFSYCASSTITFMCGKSELYYPENRAKCGIIHLYNPGFPENGYENADTFLLSPSDYSVPSFHPSAYKNTRGHLLIAGGSDRYPGAPLLSSLAAFHSGCGLVTLLSKKSVLDRVYNAYPSIMGIEKGLMGIIKNNAFLLGPGWDEGDREVLDKAKESGKNMVLDADAIKLIVKGDSFSSKAVLTPHKGEFRTLCSNLEIEDDDFLERAKKVSYSLDAVLVIKTSVVWIVYKEKAFVYDGENPSLGVAGSGDVLSGIIGAFLSSGMDILSASINGVILHQRCGKTLSDKLGFYSAEDIIEEVGRER